MSSKQAHHALSPHALSLTLREYQCVKEVNWINIAARDTALFVEPLDRFTKTFLLYPENTNLSR